MDMKETFGKDGTSEQQALSKYLVPSLLIIDEAQERSESDWENRVLTYMLDRRYDKKLCTVLISNLLPAEFKECVGPSVYDRMREVGGIIQCNWGNFRENK